MTKYLVSSTTGVQIFTLIAFIGTISAISIYEITIIELLCILLGYFLYGCLGIVVTYHRQLTHKSYESVPILTKILSIFGCFAGTGSPLAWVAIHINHHLKSDSINDPHSPLHKGIKIFALNYNDNIDTATIWRMRDLVTDKFHQFLHRYYFGIMALYSMVLFVIGGFWLMVFAHWAPVVVTTLMSNIVNYVGHSPGFWGGYRSYNLKDQSSNNWIWAVPSWGESWHNNHHRFPKDYTFKKNWWEFDIAGSIINLIKINKK